MGRLFWMYHTIVQLVYDEMYRIYRFALSVSLTGLSEQGQHPEDGQAACGSPEHRISFPMGLTLSTERKDRNRNTGMWRWGEPAHRKVGRAARGIFNPQE